VTVSALPIAVWSPAGAARSSDDGHPSDVPHQSISLDSAGSVSDAKSGAVNFQQLDWLDEHHHAVSAMLMQRGFVPLYPQLVKASGSLKAALMLGQAIGLSRTWLQRDRSRNGWFWMGAADWQSATGLTAREQESARQALVDADLWEERRTHNPSRLYFRVHLKQVALALGLVERPAIAPADEAPADDWGWDDATASNLLGESQMFFKPLADLAGGVMAGLLLSQLLSRQRSALRDRRVDVQGQFQIQYDKLADQLLIGDKAMRNARDQLRRAGFIAEQVRGSGPTARVHVGINLAAMMACLQVQPTTAMGDRVAAARLAGSKVDRQRPMLPTVRHEVRASPARSPRSAPIAGNRQFVDGVIADQMTLIGLAPQQNQAHALDLSAWNENRVNPDGALLSIAKRAVTTPSVDNVGALLSIAEGSDCPFVESDGAFLSTAYTEIEYREPPPTCASATAVDNFEPGRRRFWNEELEKPKTAWQEVSSFALEAIPTDLVMPEGLNRQQALRVVEAAPAELRQVLLDELAGHMRSKRKSVDSPLGFLHTITRKAIQGTLVTTKAEEVAATRSLRAEIERSVATPAANAPLEQPTAAPVLATEQSDAARAKLLELRNRIAAKAAGSSVMRNGSEISHDE
jgi:hypothetical protein